jgi:adenosine kinase
MDILLTGSVAFDYLMRFPGYFREHILPEKLDSISLSFLVESLIRLRGGTAPNIGYTLALLGARPRLFATVGIDFDEYREWLEGVGVDTTWARTVPDVYTATFFANTDRANAQIASFYPGAMAYASELSLYDLRPELPDLVVISPNDPEAMRKYVRECKELELAYLYDPSQQTVRMTPDEMLEGIEGAQSLFVNDYEYALIQKMTGYSSTDILERVDYMVITNGNNGSTILSGKDEVHVPVVPPTHIADPTGVGDAFRGGFLTAYRLALDWELCGQVGALAATYCLEQQGPQGHVYTPVEFVTRFREHFDDHRALDVLISESETQHEQS